MAYGYTRPVGNFAEEPITPLPEHYKGDNHPYRGIEDHGVPSTVEDAPVDSPALNYEDETAFDYPAETHTQEPVPVYVVNDSPIEEKDLVPGQFTIGSTPVRIMVQDRRRMRVHLMSRLKNVYIGNTESVSSNTGALIDFNVLTYQQFVTTNHLWAVCAAGDTATLYAMAERYTDNRTVEDKTKKR